MSSTDSQDYERFPLTNDRFVVTLHCFRHVGATRDFMLNRLSKDALKYRAPWENITTLYTYVQRARSLILKGAAKPCERELIDEINAKRREVV